MDLPKEVDDYIKESIDYTLGLPVSAKTLQLKLQYSEEMQRRLRDECQLLLSRLEEKDQMIEGARAESCINAQALKKFVGENQKLAAECSNLLGQCKKLERECSLFERDRDALMDFGNEADERARTAEARAKELEEELGKLSEKLQYYKDAYEARVMDLSTEQNEHSEDTILSSVIATLTSLDEHMSGRAFLEANCEHESCQKLLHMWASVKPSTQMVLSLVAEVKKLEKEKELLRINLCKAEDEVEMLVKENSTLSEGNYKLLRRQRARDLHESGGKHSGSLPSKSNKRKSSPKMHSPIEKKLDFSDAAVDPARPPLSPLPCNSPDSKMDQK